MEEDRIRVVHYLNQFFAQIGGEDKADIGPQEFAGAVGPARIVNELLGDKGEVVATLVCGDNYFAEQTDKALHEIIRMISKHAPNLVLAGPAFNAGRYGMACGEVCQQVKVHLGTAAVTAMYEENPGVEIYRKSVIIVKTGNKVVGLRESVGKMVAVGKHFLEGKPLGRPEEEGYFPQGIKRMAQAQETGAARAVKMLLAKLDGRPFTSEVKLPAFDDVAPAPPLVDLSKASIALATDGGLYPTGNPDKVEAHFATKFGQYNIAGCRELERSAYTVCHSGYDDTFIKEDPNRLVPVDAMRELEAEGRIGSLFPLFFSTTGVSTTMENSRRIGRGIAEVMVKAGVQGAILTSTWGTSTRCGAAIVREIERTGIPTVQITNLTPVAEMVGVKRIIRGQGVRYPLGNPNISRTEERSLRKQILIKALHALQNNPKQKEVLPIER